MPKTKHEQIEGGWTRVGGRSSKPVVGLYGLAGVARDITLEKLLANFENKMKVWRRSSCRKAVLKMLERECPEEGWNVNKAVCLASGSFSRDNFENTKRTMTQFVTFIDIVQHVSEHQSNLIQSFAQDPSYTELDNEFLTHFNIEVLHISQEETTMKKDLSTAQDHLGPQTMLFEFFMDARPENVQAIFEADPRFYLGSSWQTWLVRHREAQRTQRNQAPASLPEEHIDRRRRLHFPRFEEDPLVFEGLMFHWKEADDEEEDGT